MAESRQAPPTALQALRAPTFNQVMPKGRRWRALQQTCNVTPCSLYRPTSHSSTSSTSLGGPDGPRRGRLAPRPTPTRVPRTRPERQSRTRPPSNIPRVESHPSHGDQELDSREIPAPVLIISWCVRTHRNTTRRALPIRRNRTVDPRLLVRRLIETDASPPTRGQNRSKDGNFRN